jgi:hypothetical protein
MAARPRFTRTRDDICPIGALNELVRLSREDRGDVGESAATGLTERTGAARLSLVPPVAGRVPAIIDQVRIEGCGQPCLGFDELIPEDLESRVKAVRRRRDFVVIRGGRS